MCAITQMLSISANMTFCGIVEVVEELGISCVGDKIRSASRPCDNHCKPFLISVGHRNSIADRHTLEGDDL